jgi:F-type H+-transporting ATPase subunit delta
MIGSSRTSLALVRDKVHAEYENPELAEAGRGLLQVADLLGREKPLRRTLGDAGRPARERSAIIEQLLADRTNDLCSDLAEFIAGQRWSSESDVVDAYEYAGAQALLGSAERSGDLDRVENELFRFGRIVVADGELQMALTSPALPEGTKRQILRDLLDGKASPVTIELLGFVAGHLRGRRIEQAVETLTDLAAERRGKLVAVVTVAKPLDDDRTQRLASALERVYGRAVALNIEIDPDLIGGISVQVGDEIIDGSIANRLETARRRVSG